MTFSNDDDDDDADDNDGGSRMTGKDDRTAFNSEIVYCSSEYLEAVT